MHTHTPHVTTVQAAAHHTATQARAETQVIHTRTHLQSYKGIRTTIRPYSNTQSSAHTAEHAHTHTHKIRKHTIIHICSYKQLNGDPTSAHAYNHTCTQTQHSNIHTCASHDKTTHTIARVHTHTRTYATQHTRTRIARTVWLICTHAHATIHTHASHTHKHACTH